MRKTWKIIAVCLAMVWLWSALFVTVAAEGPDATDPTTGDTDHPILPDEPENPDQPDQPDEPDTPDQPDTPDTPDEPDTPDTPDEPDLPDVPDEPNPPDVPDTPDKPDEPDEPIQDPVTTTPVHTDPIAPVAPTNRTSATTATTSAAPTESITAPFYSEPLWVQDNNDQRPTKSTAKADTAEDAEEEAFPFDVRTTVICSLVALAIMVAGGVAIYIITKHKPTNQQGH